MVTVKRLVSNKKFQARINKNIVLLHNEFRDEIKIQ